MIAVYLTTTRRILDDDDGIEVAFDAFPEHKPHIGLLAVHGLAHLSSVLQIPSHLEQVRVIFLETRLVTDSMTRSSDNASQFLQPNQTSPIASSPSDIPDPSPIAPSSNGTDGTDIDDTAVETEEAELTRAAKPAEPELKVDIAPS